MLFNSFSYIAFLMIATGAYWALRGRFRIWLVLIASLIFYAMWRVEFVFLIAFSALVDWFFSLLIYGENRSGRKRLWLMCSLSINLGLLVWFKYTHFLLDNLGAAGALFGQDWALDVGAIVLPLGISFYTFLSISYTLDVYRGFFVPERNFAVYLAYVTFWPHMIAGPILRAKELLPQLVEPRRFHADELAEGIRKILFGLFLKVVFADQLLSAYVDEGFLAAPAQLSALDVWTLAFAFGLQIYFDFGGYSLIAIGSAKLLGIHFPANFFWPYLAVSPKDFWQRWHITLSSWIRDYLYLPLCGVQVQDRSSGGLNVDAAKPGSQRASFALFVSWFLMGLWHGAAWHFALWGLWHAAFVWIYRTISPRFAALPSAVRNIGGWMITLPVTMLGWIPFRATSLSSAAAMLGRIFDFRAYSHLSFQENFYLTTGSIFAAMLLAWLLREKVYPRLSWRPLLSVIDIAVVSVACFIVFLFLRPSTQFIYFQF
jgi:D-alanyl-lipoteichoic acid acyltransferase DltB (MBOAT superfamily)